MNERKCIFTVKSFSMDCKSIFNYSSVFFSYFSEDETLCDIKGAFHQLIYVYSGVVIVSRAGHKDTIVPAGKCVFIRRDHRVTFSKKPAEGKPYKSIALVFDRNFLRRFYQTLDKKYIPENAIAFESSVIVLPDSPGIESIFTSMLPYLESAEKPMVEAMNFKMQEAILTLLTMDKNFYPTLFDFTEPWKIDILDFLNENYMYELSMDDIASYTGRSLATFKRDFKKISTLTPQKWLIQKRLEIAYHKLKEEHIKISQVFSDVGFKNRSHFATAFKKQYGIAPTNLV